MFGNFSFKVEGNMLDGLLPGSKCCCGDKCASALQTVKQCTSTRWYDHLFNSRTEFMSLFIKQIFILCPSRCSTMSSVWWCKTCLKNSMIFVLELCTVTYPGGNVPLKLFLNEKNNTQKPFQFKICKQLKLTEKDLEYIQFYSKQK